MSLEQSIQNLADAINGLANAHRGGLGPSEPAEPGNLTTSQAEAVVAASKPKRTKPVAVPAPAAPQATTTAPGPVVSEAPADAAEYTYAEVQSLAASTSRILGANASHIVTLLSRFGATRLSELLPNQYPAFVQGLRGLEAGVDPSAAVL